MEAVFKYLIVFLFNVAFINANCNLNMREDLTANHPLLLSLNRPTWLSLKDSPKGSLLIDSGEHIRLACVSRNPSRQNAFSKLSGSNIITAKCLSGQNFEVDKKSYPFRDLHCNSPVETVDVKTNQQCLGKDTELIKVGYQVANEFVTEYEVCFNTKEKLTLYTEVKVPSTIDKAASVTKEQQWASNDVQYSNINLDSVYTHNTQVDTFKKILNKNFFENNRCGLEKGKLVSNDDMIFGPEQAATANYLNTVPQWSTCNRLNWLEVEKRIKNLAVSLNRPLTVYTGTYRKMTMAAKWGFSYKDMYLHYNSNSDKAIPVPLYMWKVVFDEQSQKGLAIVEVNNPHLSLTDIDSLVLCEDICKNVNWMNFLDRKTIPNGYVYCCELNNFEFGFAFKNSPFPRATGGILRDEGSRRA